MKCKKCNQHEGVFGDPEAKRKKLYCADCKEKHHVDLKNPQCKTCGRRATFGIKGTKIALYCGKHRGNCVNVSNPVCVADDCAQRASFGLPEGKRLYCGKHARALPDGDKYINLTSVRCKGGRNCPTCPVFGLIGTTKVLFCKSHIPNGQESKYVNLRDKCKDKDCLIQASFGLKGSKKRLYCINHIPEKDKDKYANIKDKTCEECELRPTFGKEGKKAIHCKEHQKEGEINVVSARCLKCPFLATFGEKGSKKPFYCFEHKKKGYVNVTAKMCEICKNIRACYNYPGYSPKYCQEHSTGRMVIFPLTKEKEPDINCQECDSVIHYNEDFCSKCKTEVKVKTKRRKKEKEDSVNILLYGNNIDYIRDKIISGGNSKKRPDYLIHTEWGVLIVEVDEFQHRKKVYTEKELKRMRQIYGDCNCENVLFIRYNPDKYACGEECLNAEDRENFLLDTVVKYVYSGNKPEYPLSCLYLFYDNFNVNDKPVEIEL